MNNIRVSFAWTLLGQLAEKGVPFFASIILVRSLDAQSYANYAFLSISIVSLAALASIGVQTAAIKIARKSADGIISADKNLTYLQYFANIQAILFIIGAVFCVSLWFPAASDFDILVLVVASFGLSIAAIPHAKLVALRKFKESSWISISGGVILLIGTVAAYLYKSIIPAQLGLAFSAILMLVFAWCISKDMPLNARPREVGHQRYAFAILLSSVAPLAGTSAVTALTNWSLAKIMISSSSSSSEIFSAFAVGMQWFALAQFLPSIVNRVTFPDILSQENDKNNTQEDSVRSNARKIKISFFSAVITVITIGFISSQLALLYDASYITPSLILLFSAVSIISAPINIYGNVIVAKSREIAWFGCTLLWAFVVITLALIFRDFGPYAAVIALALGGGAQLLVARTLAHI